MNKKVAVVIVNWNGKDDTVTCLDSLKKIQTNGVELTVYVVDNGSSNDSIRFISKAHPWIRMITTGKNLGFTGGNNVGIQKALDEGADFVWLLNNDTVVHPKALSIIDAFEDTSVGIVGSKIYFSPGREYHKERYKQSERGKVFWYAGGIVDWDNMYASHRGVDEVDHGQYDKREETMFVTGCSMMIRPEVFKRIGQFDDKYYLYLEDLDFCLRAKSAGFRLLYDPTSVVWHTNAGSSGGAGNLLHDYYLTRNRLLIGARFAPLRTKIALVTESLRFLIHGSSVKKKAVGDAFLGRFGKQYEPKKF